MPSAVQDRGPIVSAWARIAAWLVPLSLLLLTARAWTADADYQPYKPDAGEAVSAPLFVVIAYSAIWLVLIGFVVGVWRRQREVQREIDQLSRELAKAGAGGSER